MKYLYYVSFGLSMVHPLQKYIEVSPVSITDEQSREEKIGWATDMWKIYIYIYIYILHTHTYIYIYIPLELVCIPWFPWRRISMFSARSTFPPPLSRSPMCIYSFRHPLQLCLRYKPLTIDSFNKLSLYFRPLPISAYLTFSTAF